MAVFSQGSLFTWEEWDDDANLGDLKRLRTVLESLPDEELMRTLEEERGQRRDDHPVRAMWNSIVAMYVFGHPSVESLRRELARNAQLRAVCGFEMFSRTPVPSSAAYSRFVTKMLAHQGEVDALFGRLLDRAEALLPGFGEVLGVDGKAVSSRARRLSDRPHSGRRGEHDANRGVKKVFRDRSDGTREEVLKTWFGFKVHAVVDCVYELPVAFTVTRASSPELPEAERIIAALAERRPLLLGRCRYFTADRGYDSTRLIENLWDEYRIKPVIAIRNMRGEDEGGDGTRRLSFGPANITYDYRGNVYCHNSSGKANRMSHGGFESSRGSTKFRCPAHHYGMSCPDCGKCPVGLAVRIPLSEDRRVFTPLSRASYVWQDVYNRRSSCERVFSRLAGSFGVDIRLCRGLKKVTSFVSIAFSLMLAVAIGHIRERRPELIRRLLA